MAFYTSPADMPDTPKEPPTPDPDEIVTDVVPFGELPEIIKVRYPSVVVVILDTNRENAGSPGTLLLLHQS